MLKVNGCLGNEKETSVGKTREMYDLINCMWWVRKKWKYWHVNKLLKSKSLYKNKKEKIVDTTKFEVDIMLERKRKKLKRIEVRTKHLGLVENRSRPRIGGQVDHLCS